MLLERDAEIRLLSDIVGRLGSTGGKVVLIRGEAGIGKTSLINAFAAVHAKACHVCIGACDDLFIPQPLGPFWDISRLEPALRKPLDDGDRPHLLEAVLALLSRPARPTIIILEDTHWADEATLDAIRYLGRRIGRTNGILVLTYRDGEVDDDHPLRGVIGDIPAQDVVRLQLASLSLRAVSSLIDGSGLDPADVHAATGGNPFLVGEMASTADSPIPPSLHDSVMSRVHKLSAGAQELLRTLSVIPEPLLRTDVLRLEGADDRRLDECERHGLLEIRGGTVSFRHELLRRTIESSMGAAERALRCRIVLRGLPEETHPNLLIECAVVAGDMDRLLELAPRSARYAAMTGSHIQAVDDYRVLGPYIDRLDRDQARRVLDEWAVEEDVVDNVAEAIRLNGLARELHHEAGDLVAESRALAAGARYHEGAGQRGRAEALAREAITVLGPEPDHQALARALETIGNLEWMAGNVRAVPLLVEQTLAAGGPDIEDITLIRSLNHRGAVANIADYPAGTGEPRCCP